MCSPVAVSLLILSCGTAIALCHEPVVGVLTQETYWSDFSEFREHKSYIAASYVKAIEASGGKVVPVFTNKTTKYYANVMSKINGILVPGGWCAFDSKIGIGRSTMEVFRIAKLINNLNDHFPIIGLCLGYELLLMASINGKDPLISCEAEGMNLPLKLIPHMAEKSVLFQKMPEDIKKILLEEPVTANHHYHCITNENFTSMHLNKFWNAITTNEDEKNLTFISMVEAKNYPFLGLQFHPEKNAYEWEKHDPHNWSAIYSARYFYDWFINECRKSKHKYKNRTEMKNELINNYPKTFVGKSNFTFEEVYFFNE